MKREIKERIEKIRRGEVPEGYKETKVGIIPVDWEVKKLAEIADIKTGPFGSALHEKDYVKDGTPIITVEHLGEQGVVHDNLPMVSDFDRNRLKSYVLKIGDIVFSRVGSVDRNSLIRETENGWLFSGRLLRIRVTTVNISPSYLSYHFHQEITKQRIRSVAVGQTMASLNTQILKDILVSFPPTSAEQQKIAEILITWDKAIELKEKLIEKKKEFKRGLMQKLLTGEMRFLEFTDDWEETRLGKKLTFIKKESIENPQNYRLLTVKLHLKGIEATENCPKLTENGRPYHLRYEGELLIGRQNFHNGGIGIIPNGMNGYIASNAISSLKSSDDNLLYYYYYLSNPNFYKKVEHLIGGTGQKEISESMFKKLKIKLPSNDKEIKKISETIKDIYQDLELENNILSQLKEQKIGLMQLLLTGIVRVEVD